MQWHTMEGLEHFTRLVLCFIRHVDSELPDLRTF